ncbi:MAG: PAS domain-containing protein [Enterobacterales bacterium]|nr:PAS domain-containing protein [Enterobacterales bacterium]
MLDDNLTIMHAINSSNQSKLASDLEFFDPSFSANALQNNRSRIKHYVNEEVITAYYPIALSRKPNEIRPSKQGLLYMVYQFSDAKTQIWHRVRISVMPIATALLLVMGLFIFFINRYILSPIQQIRDSAKSLSDNIHTHDIKISGDGEFARLSYDFNKMLVKRRLYEHNLDQSHQKIVLMLQKLEQSEERFELAMSVANGGIWDWDLVTDKIVLDDRYYTMAGYRAKEFPETFLGWKQKVHADDLPAAIKTIEDYLQGLIIKFTIEFRFLKKDGSYMWILSKGQFVAYDKQGNPTRMVGTHRDITEQKLANIALANSEFNLLYAQKTAKIGHFSFNTLKDSWSCSIELERIFGLQPGFNKNLNGWLNIIHPEDRKSITRIMKVTLIQEQHSFNREYRIIDQITKQQKWVRVIGHLKFDQAQTASGVFGTVQDITQQKQIEIALQTSRDRQALLVNTIPYGIQECDINGKITFSNKAHYRILEIKPPELTGRYIWDFEVDQVARQKARDYFNHLVDDQPKPTSYLTTNLTASGKKIQLEIMWDYQRDENNQLIGFISVISDITQQQQSEKALQRAQKMEAIGQLTGGIAHDFNNILGVIIGNLDLLATQCVNDQKASKRVTAASKAAQRAENLTRQLLGFSRVKATETKVTDLNRLIRGMDEVISHSLGKSIDITYQFTSDLWPANIDRGDLQDALLNLLLNAKDAVQLKGKVIIETKNTLLDKAFCKINSGAIEGEYACITVSDDGEGIEKAIQSEIFEPFFTTKSQGKGTGLGLSMVFGFVKRSGGYIEVYSEPRIGTTFKIYLPKCKMPSQAKKTPLNNEVDISKLKGNETLLIVDDEEGLLELCKITLEQLGYKVLLANDGNQASDILDSRKDIALVFSDIVMPGELSGFELAKNIQLKFSNIKILLTSGYTGKAADSYGLYHSQFELLSKPYTQQQMVFQIRNLLDSSPDHKTNLKE